MADKKKAGTAGTEAPEGRQSPQNLQEIQLQMNAVTDDSLESTRRMLALCEESKDAGIRTLVMLDEQGEQLDRMEEGMDQINQDMRDAEKNLEGMEKCCGLCVLPWKRSKNFEKGANYNQTWGKQDDGKVNSNGPRVVVGEGNMGPQGGFVTKITNDAREDEMEQNMGEVNSMIGNLRNMAVDMGNEIESQNKQIDRVNQKVKEQKQKKKTNKTQITNDAREDEMEQNMGEVNSMIGNLRNMAVDMGNEIESQNKQIDRVNDKTTSNQLRITEANKRANKLLKD